MVYIWRVYRSGCNSIGSMFSYLPALWDYWSGMYRRLDWVPCSERYGILAFNVVRLSFWDWHKWWSPMSLSWSTDAGEPFWNGRYDVIAIRYRLKYSAIVIPAEFIGSMTLVSPKHRESRGWCNVPQAPAALNPEIHEFCNIDEQP